MGIPKSANYRQKPINPVSSDVARVLGSRVLPFPQLPLTLNPIPANSTKVDEYNEGVNALTPIYSVAKNKRLIIYHIWMWVTAGASAGVSDIRVYDNTASVFTTLFGIYCGANSENAGSLPSPMPCIIEPNSILYLNPDATHTFTKCLIQGYLIDA